MDVYEAATHRRTIRRYKQEKVPKATIEKLVNAARLAPSGSNLQPCEYVAVTDKATVDDLFTCLKWAGYIAPAGDPPAGQTPVAYVVVLINRRIREAGGGHDAGAAIENMLLVAHEEGLGSCWIGSVDRPRAMQILSIPPSYEVDSVVALGHPNERSLVEEATDSIKYWKDERGVMHVPKRPLKGILHFNRF